MCVFFYQKRADGNMYISHIDFQCDRNKFYFCKLTRQLTVAYLLFWVVVVNIKPALLPTCLPLSSLTWLMLWETNTIYSFLSFNCLFHKCVWACLMFQEYAFEVPGLHPTHSGGYSEHNSHQIIASIFLRDWASNDSICMNHSGHLPPHSTPPSILLFIL